MVLQDVRWRVRVVVLWCQRDDDPEKWVYLERMRPEEFSYEVVKQRWGGGAYRIRLFGSWDPSRRQEKYITQDLARLSAHPGLPRSAAACGARRRENG